MRLDQFLKQLIALRNIQPSEEYSEKSLRLILASVKTEESERGWGMLLARVGVVGATATLALIVVSNSSIPLKLAGLDSSDLLAEAEVLEVSLKLAEIKETLSNSQQIDLALEESAKSGPGHLNTTILKRETEEFKLENYHNESIDKALEEVAS